MFTNRLLAATLFTFSCKPVLGRLHGNLVHCSRLLSYSNIFNFDRKQAVSLVTARNMATNVEQAANEPNRHLDYDQLLNKKQETNVVVIDVRELSELKETGRIPGSIHIPLGELQSALKDLSADQFKQKYNAEKPTTDKELIFSCKSGGRSFKALQTALSLGYNNAKHFKGGWTEWANKTSS